MLRFAVVGPQSIIFCNGFTITASNPLKKSPVESAHIFFLIFQEGTHQYCCNIHPPLKSYTFAGKSLTYHPC